MRFILTQLQQAIKGEVVMTEELQETLYAIYDAKVGDVLETSGCNAKPKIQLVFTCICDARFDRFVCVLCLASGENNTHSSSDHEGRPDVVLLTNVVFEVQGRVTV